MAVVPSLASNSLNVVGLDFAQVRANIVSYLSAQTEFTDYDFTGSGISILLDVLAYNTHYMGMYTNMAFNEMYLETAKIRKNVVSKAKEIGYIPRQRQSSIANVKLTTNYNVTPVGNPSTMVLSRGTEFLSNKDNITYVFTALSDTQFNKTIDGNGVEQWDTIAVLNQGTLSSFNFVSDGTIGQLFTITTKNIDTNTITVNVTSGSVTTEYLPATSFVTLSATTKSYFIQESRTGEIEIYFGDNNFGQALQNNDTISVTFLFTDGIMGNDCSVFTLSTNVIGNTGSFVGIPSSNFDLLANVVTDPLTSKSNGGADVETIDEIKLNAPNFYQAQNRAITAKDYESILLANNGFIEAMSVWGGETNVPPQYGRIFMSIKPNFGDKISAAIQTSIVAQLADKKIINITPEFVDPNITLIAVTSNVEYNKNITTKTAADISTLALAGLQNYFNTVLLAFKSKLVFSKMVNSIDSSDTSIIGNVSTIKLSKLITPIPAVTNTFSLDFQNPIGTNSVLSSTWNNGSSQYQVKDDGTGNLFFYADNVQGTVSIGTVNYTTGVIDIPATTFPMSSSTTINIFVTPTGQNITTARSNLLRLDIVNTSFNSTGIVI